MEQTDFMEQTKPGGLPVMPERKWDPEKAARRKVRVIKVPNGQDPMKEKTVFEFGGFVYMCYAVKTRSRYMIRCLGIADVEKPAKPELTPFETGKLLDNAADDLVKINEGEVAIDGQSSGPDQTPDS